MLNVNTYNELVRAITETNFKVLDNNDDLYVYPVTDIALSKVRNSFNLHVDEEVLYIRDTSFWSSGDQGLVMTDWGVTIVPDNDNPENVYAYSWNQIESAEYRGRTIYLFLSESDRNNNVPLDINFFLKETEDDSICKTNGEILAWIISTAASTQVEDTPEKVINRMKKKYDDDDYDGVIEDANLVLNMSQNENYVWDAHLYAGYAYKLKGFGFDPSQANNEQERKNLSNQRYDCFDKSLEEFSELENLKGCNLPWVYLERAIMNDNLYGIEPMMAARRYYIAALKTDDNDNYKTAIEGYERLTNHIIHNGFNCYYLDDDEFAQNAQNSVTSETILKRDDLVELRECAKQEIFTNFVPFADRQFIMFAKTINHISGMYDPEKNINWVFTLDEIPKDIVFEGYPEPNVLYIAHPVRNGLYLQFEGAEDKLFMDKVREFCYMVQCLGAKEVEFRSIRGKNVSLSSDITQSLGGKLESWTVDAEGKRQLDESEHINNISKQSVGLKQVFNPTKEPYCPNDLVWLETDTAWKLLVKQRLEGDLLTYHYKISSSDACQMSNSRFEDIKGSFDYIMCNGSANYDNKKDTTFSKHEETEWEIIVTFKSKREFGFENNNKQITSLSLLGNEQEFLNEYKECLLNGNGISASERRLLDKLSSRLGISPSRVAELEASVSFPIQFSEEEQEYLEEYRSAMKNGNVSPTERRLLDKLLAMYNISIERAREIERFA